MKSGNENLVVRQHDRHACRLPAVLRVSPEQRGRVVLARTAGDGNKSVRGWVVDCSSGGIGLESPIFLPRACKVDVRVMDPAAGPDAKPIMETTVRVQRAAMLDRVPNYYLGGAFALIEDAEHRAKLDRLFELIRRLEIAGKVGAGA